MNIDQNNSKKSSERRNHKKQNQNSDPPKKDIHPIAFLFIILVSILLSYYLLIYYSYSLSIQGTIALTVVASCSGTIVFVTISCFMSNSKYEMLCLYFLLDNIFITFIAAVVGLIGTSIVNDQSLTQNLKFFNRFMSSFIVLTFFCMGGTFRILLLNCRWKKWQVIIMKLCLVVSSVGYMVFAAQILFSNTVSDLYKEFIFLYVFGLVSFYFEIYGKITDIDGTNELKYHYSISSQEQRGEDERQILENNRKIMTQNIENHFTFNEINQKKDISDIHSFDQIKT